MTMKSSKKKKLVARVVRNTVYRRQHYTVCDILELEAVDK